MSFKFVVLDDEENIASLVSDIIQTCVEDSEVFEVRTNKEAIRVLTSITPNLITTDIYHPGGSGLEFLSWLRCRPETEFVPVIAITGHAADNEQLSYFKHGFDAVIPKPFLTQELIAAVTRLLRLRADPDLQLVHLGRENESLDYKETIDLESKRGTASLAKDVMAMANWGGGTIVVGVAEPKPGEFLPRGVPDSALGLFETTRLNRTINEFLDPHVSVAVRRAQEENRTYILLTIPAAKHSLIFAKRQNDEAGLYPGRIYSRSAAVESAEVRTSFELRQLLDRLRRDNA
jgi:CheY-like chemotaxis protein